MTARPGGLRVRREPERAGAGLRWEAIEEEL
jgi:hypothetical protein